MKKRFFFFLLPILALILSINSQAGCSMDIIYPKDHVTISKTPVSALMPCGPVIKKVVDQINKAIRIKAKDNSIGLRLSSIEFTPTLVSEFSEVGYGCYQNYLFSSFYAVHNLRGPPSAC